MAATIQVRRGTASQWTTANPTLAAGEIGFESDNFKIKIGNGSTAWNSLAYAAGGNQFDTSIVFEGATADSFETTLQVTDPTADRTITLPDATGTVALTSNLSSYAPLSGATFTGAISGTSLTLSGDLTVNGTTTTINSTAVNVNNQVVFEGATADAFETTLTVVDPTADRTITFKDASGTVAFTSDITITGSSKLSAFAATTSSELAGVISDETGTGALVFANTPTLVTPILGTPTSVTLTNATGLPITGLVNSTSASLGVGTVELGHATDTTIARASAGVVTIEGVNIVTTSSTDTLTNKTLSSALATTALTLNATAELRLADTDSSHYVGFKSPATVATNRIWTLPSVDGTSGQALQTNGSGTLSWATVASDAKPDVFMLMGA